MHDLIERAELTHPRLAGPDERFESLLPDLLEGVSPLRVQRAFLRATEPKAPVSIDLFHVAPIRASVADALDELVRVLPEHGTVTFRQLVAGIADRIEVVVRFLAILELFKQGRVDLVQAERFGDIAVQWNPEAVVEGLGVIDNYDG
jgi:segregation and condensation protein A